MSARTLINEADAVVDNAVCVTVLVEIAVRSPAITDNDGAKFDPSTNNVKDLLKLSFKELKPQPKITNG
jgi:hypothetical protein